MHKDSLLLYRNRPARVNQVGDKLEIELEDGKTLKVRPKDVTLLHPGPIRSLGDLTPLEGEVETAWELLAGEVTSLAELAELIYEHYSPASAWATWLHIEDGLYFRGTPDAVVVCLPEQVAQEQAARVTKAAEKEAWSDFLERVRKKQIISDDSRYLVEVEQVAFKRQDKSRVLRELGYAESAESAHALLLELGYWDVRVDPYPQRLGLATTAPQVSLSRLPDEPRLDLTHLPAFAIDDAGSDDPDDALSLERNRLWVHVADVAALVSPDSPADQEARARGANLYLPEGTVPMLPEQATERLALGLTDVSPALSFGLDLGPDGAVEDVKIEPSSVRVTRLSYREAESQLNQEPLRTLHEWAQRFRAKRRAAGAVEINLPEVKVRVEHDTVVIRPLPELKSRALVREAMLMAGEAIARFALAAGFPFPYTTQDPADASPVLPDGLAGMYALRRTMRPGQVRSMPGSHAGLGLAYYARVTSPLRRYLDLVAHQQLRAYLRGSDGLEEQELLSRVGAAEALSSSVRQTERLANKHWTLVYLLQNPDWRGEGVVVEKLDRRCTILIPELDLEVRTYLRDDLPLNSIVSLTLPQVNLVELGAHFQVERVS